MTTRPSWDEWALGIAQSITTRADCTRRKVGALILGADHRPVSFGYNGAPPGVDGCLTKAACPRGRLSHTELPPDSPYVGAGVAAPCTAVHAEENALLWSDPAARKGGTIYVSDAPCPSCERLIRGSGLARAVWPQGALEL